MQSNWTRRAVVSMIGCALVAAAISRHAEAHPVFTGRVEVVINAEGTYEVAMLCDLTAFAVDSAPGHVADEQAEQLRTMSERELAELHAQTRRRLLEGVVIRFDGERVEPTGVTFPPADTMLRLNEELGGGYATTPVVVELKGAYPARANTFQIAVPQEMGQVALSVRRQGASPTMSLLVGGEANWPYLVRVPQAKPDAPPDAEAAADTDAPSEKGLDPSLEVVVLPRWVVTGARYLKLGFEHIVPKGFDHILFVLGLFLLSPKLGPLLWQVTAFTVAHSVTLALSIYGVVSLPAEVVEPIIALSIAFVALENLFTSKLHAWRPVVVFGFGLLHGLGFAGVLTELGLPEDQYVTALVTFNIGVELGQLAVIGVALLAVGWFRHRDWYRPAVVLPTSLAIAFIGLDMVAARTLGISAGEATGLW